MTAAPEGALPRVDADCVVVGAGIIGLATARELQRRNPRRRILVVEKEDRVGFHQTGRNSGVIHAGVYYEPGSLKARLCREGLAATYEFCERHAIPVRRTGKLIVATTLAELPALAALHERALANGVSVRRLDDRDEIAAIEPSVAALAALHVDETGIVDYARIARTLAEELRGLGAEIRVGFPIDYARATRDRIELGGAAGSASARAAIFCAGLQSDRLARMLGAPSEPRILPFRGSYLRLAPARRDLCRGLVYPVPDPALPFLGVHLTRTIDDEVLVGPTALLAASREGYGGRGIDVRDLAATVAYAGSWRMMRRFWRAGARELQMAARRSAIARAAARLVPALTAADLLDGPEGVRAQAVARDGRLLDDFAFSSSVRALHVRNAPSPGATSAFAIARVIADRAAAQFGDEPAANVATGAASGHRSITDR